MAIHIFNIARQRLINIRMLLKIMGWLLMIEALFMAIPTAVSIAYGEKDALGFVIGLLATLGTGLWLNYRARPTSHHMGKRDGFLLTAMVWIIFSLFGLIPFMLCSRPLSFSDGFFEAMSGFTTTGATILTDGRGYGHGFHLWRALQQWIGGMGIIVFTLAVLPMLNSSGGMQMFNAEVTGITHDKIRPRISQTAKSLWIIYIIVTVILIALLAAGPMSLFDSVCHAFGTISTGGYSSSETGFLQWSDSLYNKVVITIFMFIGGMNFALIYKAAHWQWRPLFSNSIFRTYCAIILAAYVLFAAFIVASGQANSWEDVTIDPLFQVVSNLTSTGYSIPEYLYWGPFTISLALALMFFGGCAGGTSGGAKIDRVVYLLKNLRNELYRCLYPNAILSVKVNGRVVNADLVAKVVAFLAFYVCVVIIGSLMLSAMNIPIVDSFIAALACMSNSSFDPGITLFGSTYATMPTAAKWILAMMMMIGRLEIFTILILFTPSFWRR